MTESSRHGGFCRKASWAFRTCYRMTPQTWQGRLRAREPQCHPRTWWRTSYSRGPCPASAPGEWPSALRAPPPCRSATRRSQRRSWGGSPSGSREGHPRRRR